MRAEFQVLADGSDISPLLRDRLISIQITDKPGLAADTCEIRIDDRDGKVAVPPKGASLRVSLGWAGRGLSAMGTFKIDEVTLESSPMTLTLHGRSADLRKGAKSQRSEGYEATTLAAIVGQVARRQGWKPECRVEAAVPRADQINESDLHFITRMALAHGATAAVKAGRLLVLPRGGGKSAGGAALPVTTLMPYMLSHYRFTFADRASVGAVKTVSHDAATGRQAVAVAGNAGGAADGAVLIERHVCGSPQAAQASASARLAALNRATASGVLTMSGRADIGAECRLALEDFKAELNGVYLVESVTHIHDGKSWRMQVAVNADNGGKTGAATGKGKEGPALVA
ncbi:phage late control D family protein [Pseudoduganella namucuonensis]|uniref:Late control protein n=1 Tax=Pseudoduganella namucuonensis TaxID=1035707 RepID=A0A1I7J3P1_9BURK|nr:contractile injection system protein, VgrG/Pvc8 family [Pseudoduganella namucuonensis]SFU79829.1 hypothetical protein SAMN05216552_101034 [Pseudoduganella namucuonensis]